MTRKKPILIADDDVDDRYLTVLALREFMPPEKIVLCESGLELLEYLDSVQDEIELPGLIILDINMPVLDGITTLTKIKSGKRYKNIPVVIFTTSQSPEERARCFEIGAADFVTKPFTARHNVANELLSSFVGVCSWKCQKDK